LDDASLLAEIRNELSTLLKITAAPLHHRINRWTDGFVRAPVGHLNTVDAIRQMLPAGVAIAGAAYDGVGVSDCIRQAWTCVDQLCAAQSD
jgi:oxygen-dependent protoporphyrinogen oxidase